MLKENHNNKNSMCVNYATPDRITSWMKYPEFQDELVAGGEYFKIQVKSD